MKPSLAVATLDHAVALGLLLATVVDTDASGYARSAGSPTIKFELLHAGV